MLFLLCAAQLMWLGAACDSGLDWGEKGLAGRQPVPPPLVVDRSSWPEGSMKARADREQDVAMEGAGWPFGADATSFAATITFFFFLHKMEPKNGGSVFVSNFLNEGYGSG